MSPRNASTRFLFLVVLAAIAAVFLIGRFWMNRTHGDAAREAGLVPTPEAVPAPER